MLIFIVLYLCSIGSFVLSAVTFDRYLWLSICFYRLFVAFGMLSTALLFVLIMSELVIWIGD